MKVTPYFGFWCKYCGKAQMIREEENLKKYHHEYIGLTNDCYYETHVICPMCNNQLVFRESSIWRDIMKG